MDKKRMQKRNITKGECERQIDRSLKRSIHKANNFFFKQIGLKADCMLVSILRSNTAGGE